MNLFLIFSPLCFYCWENFRWAVSELGGKGTKYLCCLTEGPSLKQMDQGLTSGLFVSHPSKAREANSYMHQVLHLAKLTYVKPTPTQEGLSFLVLIYTRPRYIFCFLPKVVLHWSTTELGLWFQSTNAAFNFCAALLVWESSHSMSLNCSFSLNSALWRLALKADYPEAGYWKFFCNILFATL